MKDFKEKVLKHVKLPYFKNMEYLGLYPDEKEYVLSKIFNQPVRIDGNYIIDSNGNKIYYERSNGYWEKSEYNDNGNEIYKEYSNGFWIIKEYDIHGNVIYYEDSDGDWSKREYDTNGNKIYYENSDGDWFKREYNDNGNEIYFENSDGIIRDYR